MEPFDFPTEKGLFTFYKEQDDQLQLLKYNLISSYKPRQLINSSNQKIHFKKIPSSKMKLNAIKPQKTKNSMVSQDPQTLEQTLFKIQGTHCGASLQAQYIPIIKNLHRKILNKETLTSCHIDKFHYRRPKRRPIQQKQKINKSFTIKNLSLNQQQKNQDALKNNKQKQQQRKSQKQSAQTLFIYKLLAYECQKNKFYRSKARFKKMNHVSLDSSFHMLYKQQLNKNLDQKAILKKLKSKLSKQ